MSESSHVRQLRLVVEAEDLDQSLTFYRDTLGLCEEAAFLSEGDARVVILDAGRATLELINAAQRRLIDEVEVGAQVAREIRVAFEVDDAASTTTALLRAGAKELAPPTLTPWQSLNSRLEAPAGLQITVFQELDAPDEPRVVASGLGGPVDVAGRPSLAPLIGSWRTQGEVFGDDGLSVVATIAGSDDYEWLGPVVVHRADVTIGIQQVRSLEVIEDYDFTRGVFPTRAYDDQGGIHVSTASVDASGAWIFRAEGAHATLQPAPDGQSMRADWVMEADDQKRPWMTLRFTRR